MYTSYSKINDRFGFSTGGTFHCAYTNTRTIISAGLIAICVIFVLIIISLIYVFVQIGNAPAEASMEFEQLIYGAGGILGSDDAHSAGNSTVFNSMINAGFGITGVAFGVILLVICVIVFVITTAILHTGQIYRFTANEEVFTVEYPQRMNRKLSIEYDYIIGLKYEEWRFMFAPKCMDITIQTKQGDITFRCIHTPMSKANGITETPFNIIRERIGLASGDEDILINKDAIIDNKPGFFG